LCWMRDWTKKERAVSLEIQLPLIRRGEGKSLLYSKSLVISIIVRRGSTSWSNVDYENHRNKYAKDHYRPENASHRASLRILHL
jgi:hypothetical protein